MKELEKQLCVVADTLLKHYDPCKRKPDGCLHGNYDCCTHPSHYGGAPCPHHMVQYGCKMPNIKCKTGFCTAVVETMSQECFESFRALEDLARIHLEIRTPWLRDMRK